MPLCISRSSDVRVRARSRSSGAGVTGLRAVNGGGAVAIVADCDEKPSPTMSALRKHDAVVRRIARAVPAILPRQVRHRRRYRSLADRRCWRPGPPSCEPALGHRRTARADDAEAFWQRGRRRPRRLRRAHSRTGRGRPSGDRYLGRLATRPERARRSAPELGSLSAALAHIVTAERISRHDAGPLLLTAYHLIPRGKARAYRAVRETPRGRAGASRDCQRTLATVCLRSRDHQP